MRNWKAPVGAGYVALACGLAMAISAGAARADTGIANVTFTWTDRLGNQHPIGYTYTDGFYNTSLDWGTGGNAGIQPVHGRSGVHRLGADR